MPRDYKKEYKDYHSKAKMKKQRASRNAARKLMIDKCGLKSCKNKDIDHKDHNPLNNKINNLRIITISKNRADNKHKS